MFKQLLNILLLISFVVANMGCKQKNNLPIQVAMVNPIIPFMVNGLVEYGLPKKNENKYHVILINKLNGDAINVLQNPGDQLVKNVSYELKIPRDWLILTSIDKFNKVYTSSNGLLFKACAFAPKNLSTGINFNITVIQNAKEKKMTIKKYYEDRFGTNNEARNYKYSNTLKINGTHVESDTFEIDDDRPDGNKVVIKMATFVWEVNGKICAAKFAAPIKLYDAGYKKMMESLKSLKLSK